jgi:hypothetical protein
VAAREPGVVDGLRHADRGVEQRANAGTVSSSAPAPRRRPPARAVEERAARSAPRSSSQSTAASGARGRRRDRHDDGARQRPHSSRDTRRASAGRRAATARGLPAAPRGRGRAHVLLEGEPGHRDDRGHDAAALEVEVGAGDRDEAAQVPAAPERLHRHPVAVHLELRRRAGAAAQHRARLGVERGARAASRRRRGWLWVSTPAASYRPDPRVELLRELGDGRGEPVGAQRSERDRALRRERPVRRA